MIASLCFAVSAEAQASDCHVSNTVDDVTITSTLRWCVAKVNAGSYSGIVFDNSLTYALDTPLSLKADGGIKGNDAEIVPSASFVGGSLVEIDPGLTWKIFDLQFDGAGVVGPRGVAVGVNSRLVFDRVSLGGFDTANDGAGLWLDDADLYMSEGNIHNCRARSGGAIAANDGEINLFDVALGDNTAADSGGAVYLTGAPVFSAEDSDLVANEALQGGAVYSVGASVVLTNVEMAGNHAIDFGGGIYGSAQIRSSALTDNHADLFGGAIATDGSVTVWQSFFFGNHAPTGGAIAVDFGDSLSLEKSALFNNTGTGEAGASALQIYDGDVHVLNTTFAHNDAWDAGAAVMIDVGDLVLEHATLALNDSVNGANGLYVGPSANATSYSTMYSNAANDCDVTGGWTVDTSMDETGTCPGAIVAASQPVGVCTNNNDYQSYCDTNEGHGIATCYASEDQLGTTRHPTDCWIGAYEAP